MTERRGAELRAAANEVISTPSLLSWRSHEAPASCSRFSHDGFNHRDDGQDFPRVHSPLRDLAPKPSTNQGRRGVFRTRNLIVDSPLLVQGRPHMPSGSYSQRYSPVKIARIKEKKEKDRNKEISSSREKTDRAERTVAINLARPPRRWRL